MKKFVVIGVALFVALIVFIVTRGGLSDQGRQMPESPGPLGEVADASEGTQRPNAADNAPARRDGPDASQSQAEAMSSEGDSEAEVEPLTEEEKREAAEERLVEAFDSLTDAWMEPAKNGVTMADVAKFVQSFRNIPKARQDECIHRALNLIPDENVMLLAGVLMDRGMDKEIVETVYNDVLNRDEDVKKPILRQIFKDKSHPCWADTAWILDVTGELEK